MIKNITAPRAFLIISLTFGILSIIITPPFQPQDEIAHFYRAWQVSTGQYSSIKQNQRLGGYVPISLKKFYTDFRPYNLNTYNRISPKQLWSTHKTALEPDKVEFTDFTNTALYSSVLYLPQALGIFLGRLMGLSPFGLLYLGRLFNLLAFVLLTFYAIKKMPFKKWLIVLLASLPMSFIVNSSLSADVQVNSIAYLTIAIILNYTYNENLKKISHKHVLFILILSVLIGLAKLVYVPILLLTIFIPSWKFNNARTKIIVVALAVITGFGTAYAQKSIVDSKYIPYSEYNVSYRDYTALNKGCDINKQLEFIKENPKQTVKVFIKSFFFEFKYMTKGYVGIFGWGHVFPPSWFVYLAYLVIFFVSITNYDFEIKNHFTLIQRGYFLVLVAGMTFLIMLSQYLSWDIVGEKRAYPLIGRYFIPVSPLFFVALSNLIKLSPNLFKQIKVEIILFTFCVLSGVLGIFIIINHSYTLNNYNHVKWEVNYAFKNKPIDTNKVQYIISKKDTVAALSIPTGRFVSNEKTFTGNRSLKIYNKNPYGFTLKIYHGNADDKIIASCRTYGLGGFFDFQESPGGVNYWLYKPYPDKDSLGWKYQEAGFILPNNIKKGHELRVFLWWPDNDSIYIDDYKVKYLEKE